MLIKEKSHFINKEGKVKILNTYDEINLNDKNDPKMGDLCKEAIPKRSDCKNKFKNYNGNINNTDFHQVSILL